ncbi:MocR-like pyridoxine biosynthesis transcription factor PdxR [Actinomadura macrotermitis]|uniref:HTH-type transcriptional regulator TauR n=1 Tax=Actinomadura macrotermitis TaxID=2585200 RepID=A0A7K0C5R1_9ACTN|nr:HTH-type transcriptional regulator TauR [Actinomadura macrotermitis]
MALPFTLDPASPEPLYLQLRAALERSVRAGVFPGGRLPSSRELAAGLGVSRNTVNLAYQELAADGIVIARPRSGYVVNPGARITPAAEPDTRPGTGPDAGSARPVWLERLVAPAARDELPHIRKPADWDRYPHPFVTGHLPPEAFPGRAWARCLREALAGEHRRHSLQDGIDADDPLLAELICTQILPGRGIHAAPERVLVTLGSQQALHLLAAALVRPGTPVAVEDPGYPDARHILARAGAALRPAPVDDAGLVVGPALAGAELVLTTPAHQYPTNVTLSGARRQRLVALARARDMVVVEDDYDGELRYTGRASPALASLDRDTVVYLGSFSKFLAPGLRLGFVTGPPGLIEALRDLRRYSIRHPPGHLQRALALLIASGDYRRGVRQVRRALRTRWEGTARAVAAHLPGWHVQPRAGGVSLWLTGPAGLDTRELAARLAPRGVLIEPGDTFFLGPGRPRNHIKLGFGALDPARIDQGVALIAAEARRLGVTPR